MLKFEPAPRRERRCALISGVGGQDGAYLARLLWEQDYELVGSSSDATASNRGSLARLGLRSSVAVVSMAPSDYRGVLQTVARIAPNEIYYLAGKAPPGTRVAHDPSLLGLSNVPLGSAKADLALKRLCSKARIDGSKVVANISSAARPTTDAGGQET